jgi:hypothetical protein
MSIMEILGGLAFPLLAAIVALIHVKVEKHQGPKIIETFFMWQLVIGLGLSMTIAGLGHIFAADKVAESIGWPAGSPFQHEVGMWDLSMGIVGLLCLKFKEHFWTAAIIGTGIFMISAGIGHMYDLIANGNTAVNNAGFVMYWDLLYPIFLAVLLVMYFRTRREMGNVL